MRTLVAAALVVAVAAPAAAQKTWEPQERATFFSAMYRGGVKVPMTHWWPTFQLYRCNVAASKRLGTERTGLAVIGLDIESEAAEAMAACASEADTLAGAAPATEVEAIKAAILRANVKVIRGTRNPPTVACAVGVDEISGLCSRPWRR